MSDMAARFGLDRGIWRTTEAKPRSRFKLRWWSLVGPAEYWPVPHSVDEVFQALAWLMEVSWPERDARYTPAGLLRGSGAVHVQPWPTFMSDGWPDRDPVKAAHGVFQRLVLGKSYVSREVLAWRQRVGIHLDGNALTLTPVVVPRPAYGITGGPVSNHDANLRLKRLLTCAGRGNLRAEHNPSHSLAIYPQHVRMGLVQVFADGPDGERWTLTQAEEKRRQRWTLAWSFDLVYGYPPPDGSSWTIPLATQAKGETFLDVLIRAEEKLAELTEADASREVDPGADVRVHLGELERAARMWGASPDAICRGVRRFKRGDDWIMEVGARADGSPEWACRWNGKGPRSGFAGGEKLDGWHGGPKSWPPDWRRNYVTGVSLNHESAVIDESGGAS